MTGKPLPTWPLPVMALAQIYVGTAFVLPLRKPGAPWSVGYASLSAVFGLVGLAILALAVRNCVRLWHVQTWEASWTLVAVTVPVTLFSALWATGPMTIGVWHWSSLVPGTFAGYLIVVLAREVRRLLARSKDPARFVDPQHPAR